jgi:phage terminase large subunit-like protein
MHVQEHLRKITDRRTKATLEIKAFDTSVLTGVKPTGVLIDELHEIARNAAAEDVCRRSVATSPSRKGWPMP